MNKLTLPHVQFLIAGILLLNARTGDGAVIHVPQHDLFVTPETSPLAVDIDGNGELDFEFGNIAHGPLSSFHRLYVDPLGDSRVVVLGYGANYDTSSAL